MLSITDMINSTKIMKTKGFYNEINKALSKHLKGISAEKTVL